MGGGASLERLGLDSVELLYVYRSRGDYDPEETLPAFEEALNDGLLKGIAVSNFETADVDRFSAVLVLALVVAGGVSYWRRLQFQEIMVEALIFDLYGNVLSQQD